MAIVPKTHTASLKPGRWASLARSDIVEVSMKTTGVNGYAGPGDLEFDYEKGQVRSMKGTGREKIRFEYNHEDFSEQQQADQAAVAAVYTTAKTDVQNIIDTHRDPAVVKLATILQVLL